MRNPLWSSLTLFSAVSAASAAFVFFFGGCLGFDCLGLCSLGGGLGGSSSLAHDQHNGDGVVNAPAATPQTNARNPAKNQDVASTVEHLQCTMLCEAPQRSSTGYSMQGAGKWLDGCVATSSSLAQNE